MHARARKTQRLRDSSNASRKQVSDAPTTPLFTDRCDIALRDEGPAATRTCASERWGADLSEEIAEMFGALVVPDLRAASDSMHRASPKDAGIRVRRSGRDPEKVALYNEQRRERRRRERRRRYARERWAELRARPLEAVEIDGVIWMKPCAELEEHRRRARERARGKRAA